MAKLKRPGSFGARKCGTLRAKLLAGDTECLPPSWRRPWMIQRIKATPAWVDMSQVRPFYAEAQHLSDLTGKLWTVGHIVPLNHPRVCGLHVPWNLQVESAALNYSKGNAWCEWHGDLFAEPEQFKLF